MAEQDHDPSLMALYRISRKDKVANSPSPPSHNTLPCRAESEVTDTMDFVKNWRDINMEHFTQNSGIANSTLDVGTLKWKSWTGSVGEGLNKRHRAPRREYTESKPVHQDPLYHLTKAEFRRLTEQLRDVNWNLSNKFKGIGFNRFKGYADSDTGSACLYRSQLALSNKAFNDEQQMWRPYVNTKPADASYTRCRPVSHTAAEREPRPRTPLPSSRARPKSSPISHSRTAHSVSWGDYDMLTADIVHNYQQDGGMKSNFGERVLVIGKDRKGESRVELVPNRCTSADDKHIKSESSTSGVASLDSEEEDVESLSETPDEHSRGPEQVVERVSPDEGQQSIEEDDKSDDERIPEPATPPDKQKSKVPNIEWGLRPEKLDAQAILEGRRDRHRYDFDASYIRQPRYEFNNVFSPALMSLDLKALAEREASLELKPTVDKREATIMMRCLELEKLQLATERAEDSRFSKTRQYVRQKSASSSLSKARAQSVRSSRPNSSKCVQDCTQTVCVGDCPEKAAPCVTCNKRSCSGSCAPVPYTMHTRVSEEQLGQTKYRLPRPKSCGPCARPSNPAKKINLQQTQLGRPKSSHSTYAHARKSVRQVMDLRASTQQLDFSQIPSDDRIHNRPQTSPPRLKSARYRKGRESVAPHKSYHSQRRVSLTANTVRPVFEVKPFATPRAKSAKCR